MEHRRDTIMRRVLRALALCGAALAAPILMTWPLASDIAHLGRTANSGDARFSVWTVAWVAHALLTDPSNLFDANIYHPHRLTLAYSEANLVAGVIAAPTFGLTGNAELAHNLVVVIAFTVAAIATWLLARRLTGDGAAAATSALLSPSARTLLPHDPHPAADGRRPAAVVVDAPPTRRRPVTPRRSDAGPFARRAGAVVRVLRDLRRG